MRTHRYLQVLFVYLNRRPRVCTSENTNTEQTAVLQKGQRRWTWETGKWEHGWTADILDSQKWLGITAALREVRFLTE